MLRCHRFEEEDAQGLQPRRGGLQSLPDRQRQYWRRLYVGLAGSDVEAGAGGEERAEKTKEEGEEEALAVQPRLRVADQRRQCGAARRRQVWVDRQSSLGLHIGDVAVAFRKAGQQ